MSGMHSDEDNKKTILHVIPLESWGGTEQTLLNFILATQDKYNHIVCSTTPIAETAQNRFPESVQLFQTEKTSYDPSKIIQGEYKDYVSSLRWEIQNMAEFLHPEIAVGWTLESVNLCRNLTPNGWLIDFGDDKMDLASSPIEQLARIYLHYRNRTNYSLPHLVPPIPVIGYEHYGVPPDYRDIIDEAPLLGLGRSREIFTYAFASDFLKDFHLQIPGFSPANTLVIEPGIDTHTFQRDERGRESLREELGIADDEMLIGRVGHCYDTKGFPEFLLVAQSVVRKSQDSGKKPPHFILCGANAVETNTELADALEEAGLRQYCHLLGPREDMARVYSAMDINLSLSRFESFGLAMFEAAACGVPSVGTDVGAHRKLEGSGIKLFPPRTPELHVWRKDVPEDLWDTESVAEGIMTLIGELQDPQNKNMLRDMLAERASPFTTEKMVHKLSALIDDQIDKGPPKPLVPRSKQPPSHPIEGKGGRQV